jgi:ATP-dependent Clp protease adaptor protein ClpS
MKRIVLDDFLHKVSLSSENEDNDYDKDDFGNKLSSIVLEEKPKLKKPPLYKVIMLNDDYTPMEFVVEMLQVYFSKTQEQATEIMLHIHQRGLGICGLYTYEIAESKANQVLDKARKNQHPLQIKLEKE